MPSVELIRYVFSSTSNDLTVSAKNEFKVSETSLSSHMIAPDSTRVIFFAELPFSDKKRFHCFPENFVVIERFQIYVMIKYSSFLFVEPTTEILMFFSTLFVEPTTEILMFSVLFL